MRCGRCGKHFDEEMYSGICPKCGHFNNRRTEYDVSRYFSAKFDDGGKTSTGVQAAKQHEKLHEMYDKYNMHRPGSKQGGTGGYPQTGPHRVKKEKNIVTPVCVVMAVLVIAFTTVACNLKKREITEIYRTVDFEWETAEAGQIFEVNDRLLLVEGAEVVDTSMMSGIAEEEKLVAVTVEILPSEEWNSDWAYHVVYLSDGYTCRECLDSYALGTITSLDEFPVGADPYDIMEELYDMRESMGEDILTESDYLNYDYGEGRTGKFYFLADGDVRNVTISFEQEGTEKGVPVLEKRVSVPLVLEEVS